MHRVYICTNSTQTIVLIFLYICGTQSTHAYTTMNTVSDTLRHLSITISIAITLFAQHSYALHRIKVWHQQNISITATLQLTSLHRLATQRLATHYINVNFNAHQSGKYSNAWLRISLRLWLYHWFDCAAQCCVCVCTMCLLNVRVNDVVSALAFLLLCFLYFDNQVVGCLHFFSVFSHFLIFYFLTAALA